MKNLPHNVVVAFLGICMFAVALPTSFATSTLPANVDSSTSHQETHEREHLRAGADVGKRVKQLEKFNKNVRTALAAFERNEMRNGHRPKHDASFSLTRDPVGGPTSNAALKQTRSPSPFRKVSLKPQEPDYSAYGVEMIFIPTYDTQLEWQGTVIFNEFDPSGAYLGQYVADVAMVPDPTNSFWNVYQEVSYQDGEAYLQYGNPYFEFGTPRDNQDPDATRPLISGIVKPDFVKAGFAPSPQFPTTRFGNPSTPKMRWVMKCTGIGTGGSAVRCGVAALFGGAGWVGCTGAAAAGFFTACTLVAIFGN